MERQAFGSVSFDAEPLSPPLSPLNAFVLLQYVPRLYLAVPQGLYYKHPKDSNLPGLPMVSEVTPLPFRLCPFTSL